jgi:hypothetical protein
MLQYSSTVFVKSFVSEIRISEVMLLYLPLQVNRMLIIAITN